MNRLFDMIRWLCESLFTVWIIGMVVYGLAHKSIDNANVYEALVWPYAAVRHVGSM